METRQRYLLRIFSLFCVHACQIIDFGLAIGIPVDANGMTCSLPPAGAVGKIFYMPPEVRKVGIPSSLSKNDRYTEIKFHSMDFQRMCGLPELCYLLWSRGHHRSSVQMMQIRDFK